MEGWDGTEDGKPSDLTRRSWGRFGQSGAKLIWGGEAVAVRHDGRANPNQLVMSPANVASIAELREHLVAEHRSAFGNDDGLLVGLQLTHSGRFSRPNDKEAIGIDDRVSPSGARSPRRSAAGTGADLRRRHSPTYRRLYCGREADAASRVFLHRRQALPRLFRTRTPSAYDRPGPFGGSLENRTRFLREIIAGVRAEAPGLAVGVRLSAFDFVPFKPGPDGVGVPDGLDEGKRLAFGGDGSGLGVDLSETKQLLQAFVEMGIQLGLRLGWQSVLESAHPPPGGLSPFGRLSSTRRPARRRRSPDQRGQGTQSRLPAAGARRLRLHLSAGLAAERRPSRSPHRNRRRRRNRPHGAHLS